MGLFNLPPIETVFLGYVAGLFSLPAVCAAVLGTDDPELPESLDTVLREKPRR